MFSLVVSGDGTFFGPVQQGMLRNTQQIFVDDWAGVRVVLTSFAIVLVWFAAVTIHELGHLLAGLAMGFRFKFLHIGRTQIDRPFRLSRISRSDKKRLGGVSFYAQEQKDRPWRCAFMILAGPAANLVVGISILRLPFQKSLMSGAFILMCAYLGIENLCPWESDGEHLLEIFLRKKDHEAKIALAQIYEQLGEGVGFEKLCPMLIAQATSLKEKSVKTVAAHLAAYRFFYNRRDYEAAAVSLENWFFWSPWAPARLREGLIFSAAVLQAYRGRIDLAEQWYLELPPTTTVLSRRQVEGAILEARGDLNGAFKKIAECEEQLAGESDQTKRESSLKALRKWKAEIEQRLASVPS